MDTNKLTPTKITKLLRKRVKGEEKTTISDSELSEWDLSAESEVFDSDKDPDYDPNDGDNFDSIRPKRPRLFGDKVQHQGFTAEYSDSSGDDEPQIYRVHSRLFEKNYERQLDKEMEAECSRPGTIPPTGNEVDYFERIDNDVRLENVETTPTKIMKRKTYPGKKQKVPLKLKGDQKIASVTNEDIVFNPEYVPPAAGDEVQYVISFDEDVREEVVETTPTKKLKKNTLRRKKQNIPLKPTENLNIAKVRTEEVGENVGSENVTDIGAKKLVSKNKKKGNKKNNQSDEYVINVLGKDTKIEWGDWQGRQQKFTFTGQSGMNPELSGNLVGAQPMEYFSYFLDEEVLDVMVDQTNLYATQTVEHVPDVKPHSRLHDWQPTDATEMKKFIGIIGWMGLVKYLSLQDYWSTNKLYDIPLARNSMSRNRFELLLRMWHFANNAEAGDNRLHKIEKLMNMFIDKFKKAYTPGETICIDESMVPWRGRLSFRQYNPRKRHKYGIKLYKLCTGKGYTWNFDVYIGRDTADYCSTSENVVYKLLGGFLDRGQTVGPNSLLDDGRTLITDNWYTSVPLAYALLEHSTHLVGTLRIDRKYLPPDVSKNLHKGDVLTKETEKGVTLVKWCDKRDVTLLSTKCDNKTTEVTSKTGVVTKKPSAVLEYNQGKFSIDLSDQMATYGSALRRCTKWYRKLLIEIIWGMVVVNSHFLYNLNSGRKKMSIKEFRENIIGNLLLENSVAETTPNRKTKKPHLLTENIVGDPPAKKRGRCSVCYQLYGRRGEREVNGVRRLPRQVYTICDTCEGNPIMCRECFNNTHK